MALGTSRELPLVYSWSLPEVSSMPNGRQRLNLSASGQRRNKPVSLSWSLSEVSSMPNGRQRLNLSPSGQRRKEKVFPRLAFSPNETLFIPINRHVIWKFPFYSGVPIGYCLRKCPMTGWFTSNVSSTFR